MSTIYCHGLLLTLYIIFTLVNINGTTCSYPLSLQHSEIAHNLSEAIVKIVEHFFVGKYRRTSFNLQVKVENPKNLNFFQDIIDGTGMLLDGHIGMHLGNGIPIAVSDEMHFSVLLVDSTESLKFLYTNIFKYHLYIEGSYFIVLHTLPSPHHYYDELYDALETNWLAGISHANILIYAGYNSILLFHTVPFTPFQCKSKAPVIHNKFRDGQWLHTQFYLSKANNMHGCALVCSTWEDMPYFRLSSRSTKDKQVFVGIEGKLLEYLAQRMNFRVTLRWMNDEEINRTIYDENGILNEHFESGTDFMIGAFHYKPTSLNDSHTPTTAYYPSTYYFVVSSKTDPYDPFAKLLLPFTAEIWLILILIYVGGNSVLYFLTQVDRQMKHLLLGRKQQRPIYNMIVISLGGPVSKDPRVPFSRFLLMVWLLATFILRTVYQGLMYHFIKNDLHIAPPKTINDLWAGYTLLMTDVVHHDVQHLKLLYERAIILNDTEVESFDMLRHPGDYGFGKIAILAAHEYFGFYKLFHPTNFEFYLVPQILYTQQLSIYMRKNSIYLNRFNKYIKNYIDEGLMNRWERFLVYGDSYYNKPRDDHPRPMDVTQLYGALNLLLFCLCACVCVFIAEVGIFRMVLCCRGSIRVWRKMCKRYRRRI